MDKDAQYNAIRDVYLEENKTCVCCGDWATQVHHIVRGTGGRARSLLNMDTWLGVCGPCHDKVEKLPTWLQVAYKHHAVTEAVAECQRPHL